MQPLQQLDHGLRTFADREHAATVRDTIEKEAYWSYLTDVVVDLGRNAVAALE